MESIDNREKIQNLWNRCMDVLDTDLYSNEMNQEKRRTFAIGYFRSCYDAEIITASDYIEILEELASFDAF